MSQRELNITVAAGNALPVRAAGDFIFCKAAARPVVVRLNGQAITMRAGDKQRIQRNAGDPDKPAFTEFDLDNTAGALPLAVQLVVGVGDYNSQIVSGELIVSPGIQTADGRFINDSRQDVVINFSMLDFEQRTESKNDVLFTMAAPGYPGSPFGIALVDDAVYTMSNNGNQVAIYDRETGAFRGRRTVLNNAAGPMANFAATALTFDGRRALFACGYFVAAPSVPVVLRIDIETVRYTQIPAVAPTGFTAAGAIFLGDYLYVRTVRIADTSDQELKILDRSDFTILHTMPVPISGNYYGLNYEGRRDTLVVSGSSDRRRITLTPDGLAVQSVDAVSSIYNGSRDIALDDERNMVYTPADVHPSGARAWEDRTYYGRGFAITERASVLIDPERQRDLFFPVSRVRYGNRVGMAGPVIRAAIELLTGAPAPTDYLDYVYGLSYFDPSAQRQRSTNAGGRSFLAASVADDFIAIVPGSLTLTVRDGLL